MSFGCDPDQIEHYTCYKTNEKMTIDGKLDENSWLSVQKSPSFVDIVDGSKAVYDTKAALLWDNDYLYVGYWVEEPNLQAQLTERDTFIFEENDVELFIAGEDAYYELEINALGTIYEVFFIWQDAYEKRGFHKKHEFRLNQSGIDILGGFQDYRFGKHPRGKRWAFRDWDFRGLQSAVHLDGTLNDSSDIDRGWTVEVALRWKSMTDLASGRSLPPKDGDIWRIDFSRFEKMYIDGIEVQPHPGWVWSTHGVYDSHIPECFTYIHFSTESVYDN